MSKIFRIARSAAHPELPRGPKSEALGTRGLAPTQIPVPSLLVQAGVIVEKVNAPLSILFGVSVCYSRRSYLVNTERGDAANAEKRA